MSDHTVRDLLVGAGDPVDPVRVVIRRRGDDNYEVIYAGNTALGVKRAELLRLFPDLSDIPIGSETTATWTGR